MTTPRATPAGVPGTAQASASTVAPARPAGAIPAGPVGTNGSATPSPSASSDRGTSATAAPRKTKGTRRPPRLASLQLKRVDPWTVLKISLIVAIVMFFVWMIAVGVLYLSLGSMDVWTRINTTYKTLVTPDSGTGTTGDLITPSGVFLVTAVIGAINIVLFTALSTIAAFVYNAAAGMSGGVEITLGERD
ncbi:Transmembrane protein of unknown function [Nakamurella panacisegetis]|uniref:DUF3566 domain-containing protein n=1 Tax=Nakamurella panacisegetis TaxID=1090615 RepID=A0A1H0L8H1_9ACTN|nr:DUF3566 domain-containing protein [Nakamurella panacisegetis]SDO64271.1 Transmembrane protein of unknown function [Nakamurella panacisegetis]